MSLPDLLQWLGSSSKTGTLQVERNRATKVIRVRAGRVVGCGSDDPAQRLGQFLISRKKINEEQLRHALAIKEENPPSPVGQILIEMGALREDELLAELAANVDEIIHSLFDWDDAVFRLEETIDPRQDAFPVDLRVDDILLRGLQRVDEMERIRSVFDNRGIVLRYTSKPPGPEIYGDETSRAMYAAIDGERTLADIVLHVHGTDYLVLSFLYDLHAKGYVEICGVRSAAEDETFQEPTLDGGFGSQLSLSRGVANETGSSGAASAVAGAEPASGGAVATATEPEAADVPPDALGTELAHASQLMTEGELEGALDVLDTLYRQNPGDDALRRLTAEAEAAFVDRCYRDHLPPDRVPVLTRPVESLSSESLTPQEFFLLSRIDGVWDVKSIIQVAPFREVDALRTLKRLRAAGMVELRDPS
jgi:hypothetical protein